MRISRLVISGFRGIRDKIEMDISPGFTIVCGPNGSGKSTICDAIEYSITGEIRQSLDHSEKGESIMDYLWWRGKSKPSDYYVEVKFEDNARKSFKCTRSRKNSDINNHKLEKFLCDKKTSPPNVLRQLCRTMILRDEEITKLSVDMKETERFEFTKNAIGTIDFDRYENKAESLLILLNKNSTDLENEYNVARNQISDLTARISELSAENSNRGDINKATKTIKEIVKISEFPDTELLSSANQKLAELRLNRDSLFRIQKELSSLLDKRKKIETDEFKIRLTSLQKKLRNSNSIVKDIMSKLENFNNEISKDQKEEPYLTSLAELYQQGKRLGLKDSCCPLCGSQISTQDFKSHLNNINLHLEKSSKRTSDLIAKRNQLENEKRQAQVEVSNVNREIDNLSRLKEEVEIQIQQLMKDAKEYNLITKTKEEFNLASIEEEISRIQKDISRLERAQAILEASKTYESIINLKKRLKIARSKSEEIHKKIQKIDNKISKVKDDHNTIRRVRGEIVEERIAELTPLMAEIYLRLRPHLDWQELNYHMRGDVRKFLSLEIGKGLNPSFLFSSGQRRAVGLSFLLAVHLSRPWCRIKTLILDDPIQHIDDYRALHLTEVLSAIRKHGWQIICTVEDRALADLLTRRLRSTTGEEGVLINMKYVKNQGVKVISKTPIIPFSDRVLVAIPTISAATSRK